MNTEHFRELLVEERRRVLATIDYLHVDNSRSIEDETEEETFDQHIADAATITVEREIENSLEESEKEKLRAIDDALTRIEQGTFGLCERCGNPIPEERLEARPYATMCVPCKQAEERR